MIISALAAKNKSQIREWLLVKGDMQTPLLFANKRISALAAINKYNLKPPQKCQALFIKKKVIK